MPVLIPTRSDPHRAWRKRRRDLGSSLGGARPKAHVLDTDGRLAIAKFPSPQADEWDVIRWEAVALTLPAWLWSPLWVCGAMKRHQTVPYSGTRTVKRFR
jgi:hypothetical protein